MLFFRKILFFIFAAIYLVGCPLLILYSFGYVYDPVEQQIARTGILSLSTMPQGADIFLEKSRFVHQTPADIRELLPGTYRITLRKKGYKPWTHTFTVEAGKAVVFDNILLIPHNWPVEIVEAQNYKTLFSPMNNSRLFLVSAGTKLGSFFIYDIDKGPVLLLDSKSPFSAVSVSSIYSLPQRNKFLIYGRVFWDRKNLYLNLDKKKPFVTDLTEIFEGDPLFVTGQDTGTEQIYMQYDNCVNRIDVSAKQLYSCDMEDIKGIGFYDEWIYAIDSNGTLFRESTESKRREILAQGSNLSKNLFDYSDFYSITVEEKGIILFLGSEGDFIANISPYRIASGNVIGFSLSNDKNLLLYWTKSSVGTVNFSIQSYEVFFGERFILQQVFEKGQNIKQCFWAYENSHILFNDGDTIHLAEIEPQGVNHVELICRILKDSDVFYDRNKHFLYYLNEKNGMLERIRVFPD